MLEFMVLSAPRSASTWVSNWLTTERTLCLHDPVLEYHPEELDSYPSSRRLGIACTALALLPDFVNAHPARKVIVHRDIGMVNRSLIACGLSALSDRWDGALGKLQGLHVYFDDLFNPAMAEAMYQFLTESTFDPIRHAQLCAMHVEPHFDKVAIKPDRARAFRDRVQRAFA